MAERRGSGLQILPHGFKSRLHLHTLSVKTSRATLAIDIGATKIAIAIADQDLRFVHRRTILIADSSDLTRDFHREVLGIVSNSSFAVSGIGIASAGPINRASGVISPVNIPAWRDFNVVASVQEILPEIPISFLQDAVAVAYAEKRIGAGVDFQHMLGMVVSTGVGGGLILNNEIFHGELGNAGFFGHHSIDFNGALCRCARLGCVESISSGPSMVDFARESGWAGPANFESLSESARAGDQTALAAIDRGTRGLAVGILNTLAILDISAVVVGGGVSFAGDVFWRPFHAHLKNEFQHMTLSREPIVVPAKLAKDAGLLGAALSAKTQ